jgi:hypothetical protein
MQHLNSCYILIEYIKSNLFLMNQFKIYKQYAAAATAPFVTTSNECRRGVASSVSAL